MVKIEVFSAVVIAAAFLPPLALYAILALCGNSEWAGKALIQAVRWIVAGIWVGIILSGAREWGSIGAFILAMGGAVALTGAEYLFLWAEARAEEDASEKVGLFFWS